MRTIIVSCNKFAEFACADAARREAIIRELKRASTTGYAPYYSSFKKPAGAFLIARGASRQVLIEAAERLKKRGGGDWHKIDASITREALAALERLHPKVKALGYGFESVPAGKKPLLAVGNLNVRVSPDLLVAGTRRGRPVSGGLRFYLAKQSRYQLTERGAELVAAMLHESLVLHPLGGGQPDPSCSMVVQCLQQRVTLAPSDISRCMAELATASAELIRLWHVISTSTQLRAGR